MGVNGYSVWVPPKYPIPGLSSHIHSLLPSLLLKRGGHNPTVTFIKKKIICETTSMDTMTNMA